MSVNKFLLMVVFILVSTTVNAGVLNPVTKKIIKEGIDLAIDPLFDPDNTDAKPKKDSDDDDDDDPQKPKKPKRDDDDDDDTCNGSWVYQWSAGQPFNYNPAKSSGGYIAYANTFADEIIEYQKKYGRYTPPNFRTDGGVREHNGRYYQNIEFDWINGYGNFQERQATIVKYCKEDDKDKDDDKDKKPKSDDDDDDTTKPKKPKRDDDDDDPNKPKKPKSDDDDDDDPTKPKKKKSDDDDDGEDGKNGKNGKDGKDGDDDDDGEDGKDGDKGDDGKNGKNGKDGKDGDDDDDDDGSKPEKPSCDYSPFHKKICEWLDWTQKKPDLDDKDKDVPYKDIDYKDPSEFSKSYIDFGDECPILAPKIPLGLFSFTLPFDFTGFCSFLSTYVKPVLIFLAYLKAAFFVADGLKI